MANQQVAQMRAVIVERERDAKENVKTIKELNKKLDRYRKMFIESRKENDVLFQKITGVIESAELPDGEEILELFNISRDPKMLEVSRQLANESNASPRTFKKMLT